MAYKITEDCNNCTACEPECPNNAISMGSEIYEIDPNLCTECVGFFGEPQCAAVCPIEVCIVDPDQVEDESTLLERAKKIHPEKSLGPDSPSHFKK